jgi:hypothetical protein
MKLFTTALIADTGSAKCFNIKSFPVQFTILVGGAINQMFLGYLFFK